MLAKIEIAYLSTLRVVILVAATVALGLVVIGLLSAIPSVIKTLGVGQNASVSGGTLSEFIDEQKIVSTTSTMSQESDFEPFISEKIKSTAFNIVKYLGNNSDTNEKQMRIGLQELSNSVDGYQEDYESSLLSLSEELIRSKGQPLSEERIGQLIEWHHANFQSYVSLKESSEEEGRYGIWSSLTSVATAFGFFVGLIFLFLFIKIERNLRPNEVVQLDKGGDIDAL